MPLTTSLSFNIYNPVPMKGTLKLFKLNCDTCPCELPGTYALTVREIDEGNPPTIKNYRINKTKDGSELFFINPQRKFNDVQDVIRFHSSEYA